MFIHVHFDCILLQNQTNYFGIVNKVVEYVASEQGSCDVIDRSVNIHPCV